MDITKERYVFEDLIELVAILRAENGCAWDRIQTHESFANNLIEESYEVKDAINKNNTEMLYDELGDVLLQVVFQTQIAVDNREFELSDVTTAICKKLILRHPHVFGNTKADNPETVLANWEEIKRKEKNITSAYESLCDVPKSMPALMRCEKVLKRAEKLNLDVDARKFKTENPLANELINLVKKAKGEGVCLEVLLNQAVDDYIESIGE